MPTRLLRVLTLKIVHGEARSIRMLVRVIKLIVNVLDVLELNVLMNYNWILLIFRLLKTLLHLLMLRFFLWLLLRLRFSGSGLQRSLSFPGWFNILFFFHFFLESLWDFFALRLLILFLVVFVFLHVSVEVSLSGEHFFTSFYLAKVRFLASMGSKMCLQISLLVKSFATVLKLANKRFLTCVCL